MGEEHLASPFRDLLYGMERIFNRQTPGSYSVSKSLVIFGYDEIISTGVIDVAR
jgi:hypothetical protein